MPKPMKYEQPISIRIPRALKDELQEAADADYRPLATLVRAILTEFARSRSAERTAAEAGERTAVAA
jgi:hypothetical protein